MKADEICVELNFLETKTNYSGGFKFGKAGPVCVICAVYRVCTRSVGYLRAAEEFKGRGGGHVVTNDDPVINKCKIFLQKIYRYIYLKKASC